MKPALYIAPLMVSAGVCVLAYEFYDLVGLGMGLFITGVSLAAIFE